MDDLFTFAEDHLYDNDILVIIHGDDPKVHKKLCSWCKEAKWSVARDWWGVNDLHFSSAQDPNMFVSFFSSHPISLQVSISSLCQ